MPSEFGNYSIELFPFDKKQLTGISQNLDLHKYSVYMPTKTRELFDERRGLWHVVQLLRSKNTIATVFEENNQSSIITLKECPVTSIQPYFIEDSDYELSFNHDGVFSLDINKESHFRVFRRIVENQLRMNVKSPLVSSGLDIIDKETEIIRPPKAQGDPALTLLEHCHFYRGVAVRFRKYDEDYFLQLIPQAKIELDKDLDVLLSERLFSKDTLQKLVSHVKLPSGNTVKLLKFLDTVAADKIERPPLFDKKSFFDFSTQNFPFLNLKNPYSPMVLVASETGPVQFSLESLKASLTFTTLSILNEGFFSQLISKLKLESANRLDRAVNWISKISPIELDDSKLQINSQPSKIPVLEAVETDLSNIDTMVPGAIFKNPPLSFKVYSNGNYKETEFPPDYFRNSQGPANQLMTDTRLKPLSSPERLSAIAFVQTSLKLGWLALERSLLEGIHEKGYRGFENTFGTKLEINTIYVDDFFSEDFDKSVASLKDKEFGCAIVVFPRVLETPEKSRNIYTLTKVKILTRGIPVQVVVDGNEVTESKHSTLQGKAGQSFISFGIALNIFVKSGGIPTALAPSFSENLLPNSLVMGYNIIRVPPKNEELLKQMDSSRRTIPLAAPLVISDNRGSKMYHPPITRLESETSLFEGENGKAILNEVPDSIKNIVIHKDGPFFDIELKSIKDLFNGFQVYPISIIRNEVPRVFNMNSNVDGIGLSAGTYLTLTPNDFVLMTTPVRSWKPQNLGWPCPILLHFCNSSSSAETKIKLLYQIYALTKMQAGSQRFIRMPISIHYSNMIARFIRRVGEPTPQYLRFFSETLNSDFIQKWYV